MPLADYLCECGKTTEHLRVGPLPTHVKCDCGKIAKRIISMTGHHVGNMDDFSMAATAQVLDRHDPNPIMVEARRNPTKRNIKAALKYAGLRIVDRNEKPQPKESEAAFRERTKPFVAEQLRKHRRIEIGHSG